MLVDHEIAKIVENKGLITPFIPHKVKESDGKKVISYGLDSSEYCVRLATDIRLLLPTKEIDVKNPETLKYKLLTPIEDESGIYVVLPPLGAVLGVSVEKIKMPSNMTVLCFGKSTLSRVFMVNLATPIEPKWEGYITFEIVNISHSPSRLYCNEGIASLRFFNHSVCDNGYTGKYQNQQKVPVAARM